MSKKWVLLFTGFMLIFGIVLAMGTQASGATSTIVTQPVPVQAPAPSYAPARMTPVATTAVSQPSPAPQPAPRPHSVAIDNQPVASDAAGQLSGFIFIVTVLFVVGICFGLSQHKQTTRNPYVQARLAKGMQS